MAGTHRQTIYKRTTENFDLLNCPDCIYLSENGKCNLSRDKCCGEKCTQQKSRATYLSSHEKWRIRMNSLTAERQMEISKKYYGGTQPWKSD